ncbi:MAG: leucyl/phenylalanyl-tRNA--protein transferase [Deltaproteobacteria bacterium]
MLSMEEDIVAVGGDLHSETLIAAYRQGIFPWPAEDLPLLWYCPQDRAILRFANLHIGRGLAKARRRTELRFTIDAAFPDVIQQCASRSRPDQDGTWINQKMVQAYEDLHAMGIAHSVEAWRGDKLVGGLYGIDSGGAFSGESMFYAEADASRLALLFLIDHLRARGAEWIDCQVMTPHFERLGAEEIPRATFLEMLADSLARGQTLFPPDA